MAKHMYYFPVARYRDGERVTIWDEDQAALPQHDQCAVYQVRLDLAVLLIKVDQACTPLTALEILRVTTDYNIESVLRGSGCLMSDAPFQPSRV